MTQTSDRVRVVLERSGGLLGRSVRRCLDTADLPESEAANLRGLVSGAVHRTGAGESAGPAAVGGGRARASAGADRFVYTLEVDRPGERAVRTFSEPVPDEVRPLLALLRTAPLAPAPGP